MNRFGARLGLVFVCLLAIGCKKEIPNPEVLDPIFKDLEHRGSENRNFLKEELKSQALLRLDIEKAEPNSIDLVNATRDLLKSQRQALEYQQMQHYYEIRAKRRTLEARAAYKAAFAKGEAWPDPSEYSDYQVNIRLREASRNWNKRVPKLNDRLANYHATPASEAPKGAKGAAAGAGD